jgi:hypothetical protein
MPRKLSGLSTPNSRAADALSVNGFSKLRFQGLIIGGGVAHMFSRPTNNPVTAQVATNTHNVRLRDYEVVGADFLHTGSDSTRGCSPLACNHALWITVKRNAVVRPNGIQQFKASQGTHHFPGVVPDEVPRDRSSQGASQP